LMYTTILPNGTLGAEVQIDKRVCECCQTSMAATPDGLIAVYRDRSDKEIRDISIVRYANGRWSQPEALTKDGWEIDGCPINGPAISSNGKSVAVAWFTAPDDKPQVNLLTSTDAGRSFGKKIRIDEGNPVGRVNVASRASGGAVVSWVERTGQGAQVRIREIAANGTRVGNDWTRFGRISADSAVRRRYRDCLDRCLEAGASANRGCEIVTYG